MKVLFISAPIGSGHVKAAQAVGDALHSIDSSIDLRYANVFDFFPSVIGNTILTAYLKILSVFPQAYSAAYGWGNSSNLALKGRNLISHYLAARMQRYIEAYNPDAIVCTHATPAGLIADLIRSKKLKVPAIAVVTDFVVHRLWIYPELSYYCVAHEDLRRDLAEFGVPIDRSIATGIPVHKRFTSPCHKGSITTNPSGKTEVTIMIMGGGAGVMPIDMILKELDDLSLQIKIIAVCGNNRRMREKLLAMASSMKHHLQVFGFVDTIPELMTTADILISKSGGMTSAEALCCGIPIVIYRPIPGQEEANAASLIQNGVALRSDTLAGLKQTIFYLTQHTEILRKMREQSLAHAKPKAAQNAANLIYSLATSYRSNFFS